MAALRQRSPFPAGEGGSRPAALRGGGGPPKPRKAAAQSEGWSFPTKVARRRPPPPSAVVGVVSGSVEGDVGSSTGGFAGGASALGLDGDPPRVLEGEGAASRPSVACSSRSSAGHGGGGEGDVPGMCRVAVPREGGRVHGGGRQGPGVSDGVPCRFAVPGEPVKPSHPVTHSDYADHLNVSSSDHLKGSKGEVEFQFKAAITSKAHRKEAKSNPKKVADNPFAKVGPNRWAGRPKSRSDANPGAAKRARSADKFDSSPPPLQSKGQGKGKGVAVSSHCPTPPRTSVEAPSDLSSGGMQFDSVVTTLQQAIRGVEAQGEEETDRMKTDGEGVSGGGSSGKASNH